MQKKPWRKLTLLVLLAAALCCCVLAVNGVGNQLQYLIEAPAYEAAQDSGDSDAQKTLPNKRLKELSESLDRAMEDVSGNVSSYTLTGIRDQVSLTSDINGSATGRLELLGTNSFVNRPLYLRNGRLFFPEELKNGDAVMLLDEQMALALFNIGDPVDRTVTMEGKEYRVIGIVRHTKQVGDLMDYGAYVPMTSVLDMECSVDALMVTATPIAGTGASVGVKSAVTGWQDGGTFIDLGKESMGAKLWLRLLLFLAGITLTLRAVCFLNRRVHDALRDDRERLKSSYAVRLMPRFIRQGVMLALGYLLCAGAAAVLMQYVIAPVYTFPEWIPAVLVEWEEIGKAFWKCWQPIATLMELRSPEYMRLRFYGLMIQLASAAAGITLALLYGRLRTREERQVESLRTMYKMGATVSVLRTTKPGPLLDMDYIPVEQEKGMTASQAEGQSEIALARILNARKVLELLPNTTAYGSFIMGVTDGQIPQNNGNYQINCTPEGKRVEETEANYDLQMDMRCLTRLVYGRRSLRDFLEDAEGFDMTQRCPTMDGLFSHHLSLTETQEKA